MTLPCIPAHPTRLGLPVFLLTFALYTALVPWMVRVWQRTGDEPHYLLAAHSLAFDGDFDLSNNYAQRDYLSFYGDWNLTPHTRPGRDGQAVLTHNLGLSLLIAPVYRLGGFTGVMYFLAALGALLAANIFLLGYQFTHNPLAAVVGWIALSFTPPVLWYVFLIYPEMLAGLCLIVVLRHLLSGRRPLGIEIWELGFALALLPWLSSRYLPLFSLLIVWAAGRAFIEWSRGWLFVALGGVAGAIGYSLFSLWLYGSAAPTAAYAGPTPLGVEESFALVRFARGLLGWLMDNQRGLLVTAPIYIAAIWGGMMLLRHSRRAGLGVLLPFGATLIPVAVWGGFWIGWEHSARFLVVALPPLGAGGAYFWANARRAIAIPITTLFLGLSLLYGRAVIQQPLKGIISGPVEILKPRLNLEALIPAMARYAFIPAGSEAVVGEAAEGDTWRVPHGQSGIMLRKVNVAEFPFGWYTAHLPIQATGATPETAVARVKIFSPRGGDYFSQTLLGRDLDPDGSFTFNFASPLYDGWAFPPTVLVTSTGQADLTLGTLVIEPEKFHSLILPALWLTTIGLMGLLFTLFAPAPSPVPPHPDQSRRVTGQRTNGVGAGILALLALLSLIWSLTSQSRIYHTPDLERNVGVRVDDSLAYHGAAMQAQPEAGQEAGMLAATLPEIYAAGRYRLTVSLRADTSGASSLNVASVRVLAADAEKFAQRWDVRGAELPADGHYHRLAFEFENPRQQALTFILDYPASVGLRADVIVITPLR